MAQVWGSRDESDADDIDSWMVRRGAQLALRSTADAMGRDLWNQSTQDGGDLYAGKPSDLTALGLSAIGGAAKPYSGAAANADSQAGEAEGLTSVAQAGARRPSVTEVGAQQRPSVADASESFTPSDDPSVSELDVIGRPSVPAPRPSFLDSLDHDPLVRSAAGIAGFALGVPGGVLRGGWHALEGVGHGLNFVGGLFFPEGRAMALDDAQTATHSALQYGRSVLANPARLANDAHSVAVSVNRDLNPFATPLPDTASGAFLQKAGIGANLGETLTNAVGLAAAPEVVGGIKAAAAFAATREANMAEMMDRGLSEPMAKYLSKPYKGKGDHAVIQNSQKSVLGLIDTPWLKDVRIPRQLMDSVFNVSRPRGLSQYDFYKYHYGVDPQFYGGSLPRNIEGPNGFSGAKLGFERYSNPARTWARIPQIWKDYPAAVAAGDVSGLLLPDTKESPQ